MLKDLYPRAHARYFSLPLLGPILGDFESWLLHKGFSRGTRRQKFKDTVRVNRFLVRRGRKHVSQIARSDFQACRLWYRRRNPSTAGTGHSLQQFLEEQNLLPPPEPSPPTPTTAQVSAYAAYLRDVRGFSASSCNHHTYTASSFLQQLGYDRQSSRLARLRPRDIEEFVRLRGKTLCRASLQHTVAHLRGFLRFLTMSGLIRPGLDAQIDTPRLYRLERPPRALPWKVVRGLLRCIDRKTPRGLRDYAMFCLIATYGLRTSQIVSLTLDDIHWRDKWIHVAQRKNGIPLQLPLTDPVATALVQYLRKGRPSSPHREIFLRVRAPAGILKPTAVTEAFQYWSRRSGLEIPYHGPHCIRHSYAVHLLSVTAFQPGLIVMI